jgi:hypothetical protein
VSEADVNQMSDGAEPEQNGTRRRIKTKNLAILTIESATRILLSNVDKSRELISLTEEKHESIKADTLRPYARRLEPQDRITIEAQVGRLAGSRLERVNQMMDDERRERGLEPINAGDKRTKIYPVASEQVLTVLSEYLSSADNAIWAEMQDAYASKEIHLAFAANYYLTITQPTLMEHLATALLPSSIYSIEDYIGALARCTLTLAGAETLGDLPPVPYKVVESYGSNARTHDIKRWAIDRRTEEFVRGGPQEWRESIERWCSFDLDQTGGDWTTIREAVARARLFTRGTGRRVDGQYFSEIGAGDVQGVSLWDDLATDHKYLLFLLNQVEIASLCLSLRWAQHFFPDPEVNVDYFLERVVRFEREDRWSHADVLCKTLLDTFAHRDHPTFNLINLNVYLCAQQLGQEDEAIRRAIDNFQPADTWELIGKAALKRDWATLTGAITDYGRERGDDLRQASTMPIVQRSMKEYPPIRSLFPHLQSARSRRRSRKHH